MTQNLYINKRFNNRLWRSVLNKVIDEIDMNKIGIQVISPFGFEVMKDDYFLRATLRRFYCYIGIPVGYGISQEKLSLDFETRLFKTLSTRFIDFYNSIVMKVILDNFIKLRADNYKCDKSDILVDVQCRYIRESILDDYADYIICSLSAIHYGKDEPKEFLYNSRFRNRTYQLYIMHEKIFGNYAH